MFFSLREKNIAYFLWQMRFLIYLSFISLKIKAYLFHKYFNSVNPVSDIHEELKKGYLISLNT